MDRVYHDLRWRSPIRLVRCSFQRIFLHRTGTCTGHQSHGSIGPATPYRARIRRGSQQEFAAATAIVDPHALLQASGTARQPNDASTALIRALRPARCDANCLTRTEPVVTAERLTEKVPRKLLAELPRSRNPVVTPLETGPTRISPSTGREMTTCDTARSAPHGERAESVADTALAPLPPSGKCSELQRPY